MPKIYVKKAFRLQHKGETHDFPVGNHSVPSDVAEHWLVKAHIGDEPQADADTSAAADELLAELEAKANELEAREKAIGEQHEILKTIRSEQDAKAKELADREKAAGQRSADLDEREAALAQREQALATAEKAAVEAAAKTSKK